ncbi:MAG: hypothetical protein Q9217_002209 [Psora testacea]
MGRPLLATASGAQAEATQLLIENGADVHARWAGGFSALHHAIHSDQITRTETTLEILDWLLRKGLEIEDRDDDGHTVIHEASFCGRVGLGRAASNGPLDLLTFLLDNRAKALLVSYKAPELLRAARSGVSEIIQLLVDRGFSNQGPRSLLRAAITESIQVVTRLVDHGVIVNVKNKKKQTPMHLAVLGKRMERQTPSSVLHSRNEVIKFLIKKGADVKAVDANGQTAFDYATELETRPLSQTPSNPLTGDTYTVDERFDGGQTADCISYSIRAIKSDTTSTSSDPDPDPDQQRTCSLHLIQTGSYGEGGDGSLFSNPDAPLDYTVDIKIYDGTGTRRRRSDTMMRLKRGIRIPSA